MYLADEYYNQLHRQARRLIPHGFHPSWSPDGTRLVYTQGISLGSVLGVFDVETGRTELLLAPGRDPEWSPDGKYIAFVKAQRLLPLGRLAALTVRDMLTIRGAPQQAPEVWVMDWDTRQIRRIAEGENPHWGRRSGLLYYSKDRTLYAAAPGPGSPATAVRSGFSDNHPTVSPDEQYVADVCYPELRVTPLRTGTPVASWIIPPPLSFVWVTSLHWSPDSRTVSVGNHMISDTGLWVYDLDTRTAWRTADIPLAATLRSPDGKRLALAVSQPLYEVWIADVDPNRPTVQALGAAMAEEEHCRETIASYDRRLALDPNSLETHLHRTAVALWMGHDRAAACLQEMDQALKRTSYPDGECILRARVLLSGLSPTHGVLLPLAELLAHEAAKKQPAKAGLFASMFRQAGYPEQASALLQAYPDAPSGRSE